MIKNIDINYMTSNLDTKCSGSINMCNSTRIRKNANGIEFDISNGRIPYNKNGKLISTSMIFNDDILFVREIQIEDAMTIPSIIATEIIADNMTIHDKLTVGGLIDPTGLQLDPQTENPGDQNTLWINTANELFIGDHNLEQVVDQTNNGILLSSDYTQFKSASEIVELATDLNTPNTLVKRDANANTSVNQLSAFVVNTSSAIINSSLVSPLINTTSLIVNNLIESTNGMRMTEQPTNPGADENTLWINSANANKLYIGSRNLEQTIVVPNDMLFYGQGLQFIHQTINPGILPEDTIWINDLDGKLYRHNKNLEQIVDSTNDGVLLSSDYNDFIATKNTVNSATDTNSINTIVKRNATGDVELNKLTLYSELEAQFINLSSFVSNPGSTNTIWSDGTNIYFSDTNLQQIADATQTGLLSSVKYVDFENTKITVDQATSSNIANRLVRRDGSGNITVNNITSILDLTRGIQFNPQLTNPGNSSTLWYNSTESTLFLNNERLLTYVTIDDGTPNVRDGIVTAVDYTNFIIARNSVNNATSSAIANRLMIRDGFGSVSVNELTSSSITTTDITSNDITLIPQVLNPGGANTLWINNSTSQLYRGSQNLEEDVIRTIIDTPNQIFSVGDVVHKDMCQNWLKLGGGTQTDHGIGITSSATDTDGNMYVIGLMFGNIIRDFNNAIIASGPVYGGVSSSFNIFVAKINKSGTQEWMKLTSSISGIFPSGLNIVVKTVDSNTYVYVAGLLGTNLLPKDFNNTAIVAGATYGGVMGDFSDADVFVAKLDASTGTQLWYKCGGTAFIGGYSNMNTIGLSVVCLGSTEYVYVSGQKVNASLSYRDFTNSVISNGPTYGGFTSGKRNTFVAKLDGSDGNQLWYKATSPATVAMTLVIGVLDAINDYVLVCGNLFDDSATMLDFANSVITPLSTYGGVGVFDTGTPGNNIFISKLSGLGVQEWYKVTGNTTFVQARINDLILTEDFNIYISGLMDTTPYTMSIVPNDFTETPIVPGDTFGGVSETSRDILLAKLNTNGEQLWMKFMGEAGANDRLSSFGSFSRHGTLSIIKNGSEEEVYLSGFTNSATTVKDFNNNVLLISIIYSICNFVTKLKGDGTFEWLKFTGSDGGISKGSTRLEAFSVGHKRYVYVISSMFPPFATSFRDFAGNIIDTDTNNSGSLRIAKLDEEGTQIWIKYTGTFSALSADFSEIMGATLFKEDNNATLYITGYIDTDVPSYDFDNNLITTTYGGKDAFVSKLSDDCVPFGICISDTSASQTETAIFGLVDDVIVPGLSLTAFRTYYYNKDTHQLTTDIVTDGIQNIRFGRSFATNKLLINVDY